MRELSASEALFGFTVWLTTRVPVTTMSAKHDCAGIPDLIQEFCDVNALAEPGYGWADLLIHPKS